MTEKEFIHLPAEVHIKCDENGEMSTKLCGDALKLGYLATKVVEGIFEGAGMEDQVEVIEHVTTSTIHRLAERRKKQLKGNALTFSFETSAKTPSPDDLRKILGELFGER